jgi:hypothetical protein
MRRSWKRLRSLSTQTVGGATQSMTEQSCVSVEHDIDYSLMATRRPVFVSYCTSAVHRSHDAAAAVPYIGFTPVQLVGLRRIVLA